MKISTSMNSYAKYLCVMLTLVTHVLLGQNYVISRSFKNGVATEANDVSKTTTQIQYLDGLGRPIQSIAVGQSPTGKDVITHQAYDAFGREPNQFLPFTDTNTGATGAFRTNAATLQNTFYSSNIPQLAAGDLGRPFQETTFEASPLNRVVNQRTPGNKSNNSTIEYLVNKGTSGLLAVKRYDFQENAVLTQTVTYVAYYPDNQLTIVKITDEEGKIMLEAKDKEGQTILKRALVDESTYADTYYVYDDLSRLRAVLQPNYQTEANATKYAFLYRYDTRGRLVEKQVPGAESVEMRYDQYDRLVLSRDGNQRVNSKWSFTKYDAFNRVIMTGEISNSLAPTQTELLSNGHHESLTGAGEVKYSLNGTLPSTISESHVLTVTYYDDYNSWGALSYTNPYSIANETNLKGYLTGGRSRVIESNNTYSSFLVNTIYYDGNYRVIQTCKELYGFSSGERVTRTSFKYKYALANVVEREQQEQEAETQIGKVKTEKTYSYDHADRLMGVQHQLSVSGVARPEVGLSSMGYNELGQLSTKWLHSLDGTNYRRKQGYTYNIRGWQAEHQVKYKTEGVSGEQTQFSYGLNYETGSSKYTNGNISSMSWTHGVMDSYPVVNGSYSFTYDGLNRLKSTGISAENNEGGIDYDANGNIKLLKRWKAGVLIDDLVYNYSNGNRLNGIVDNSLNPDGFKEAPGGGLSSYAYDANGNLTQDLNKEILANKLNYNLLNLVRYVELGTTVVNKLKYVYDATGEKLRFDYEHGTDASKNETSRYVGSVEYSSNGLKRIGTGEGQIVFGSATVGVGVESYEYYLTDHLGNTREVVTSQGQLLQRTDYYGFGLPIVLTPSNVDASRKVNKYLYNGKELQPNTNWLDYGARMYTPEIGRWGVVDPLAEITPHLSVYQYGNLNPIAFTDPTGMTSQRIQDLNGNWHEIGNGDITNIYTEGKENGDGKEKQGYYTNGVMRPTSEQNAIIKPTEPKKFGTHFTTEEKAGHQGIYLGAEIIVGETVLGFLKIGQWIKSLFSLADEATQVVLKNTLPISTEGKLLGSISNGKISMYGKTLASGKFDFVVMTDGQILLGRKHTFLSGGADVLAAGELKIRGGNIVGINNLSGHYMPNLNVSSNYLNIFKKSGVDVSKAHLQIYNSQGEIIKHILPR